MPTRVIFRCQFCEAAPDEPTYRSLVDQLRAKLFGEYLDAMPGAWLTWTGNGVCGPARYACWEHRDELIAYVRKHYGTVAWNAKREGPFPRYAPPGSKRDGAPPAHHAPGW